MPKYPLTADEVQGMPTDGAESAWREEVRVQVEELSPPDTVTDVALNPYLDTLRGRYLQPRAGDEGTH